MPALHVREIPAEVIDALKRRAASRHRSLQMELREILARAAEDAPLIEEPPIRLKTSRARVKGSFRRDDIYDDGR